ncbi:hypothetical protein RJT34_26876 [Clitoria ternatea]|uniref:Late embryogenesis abundant protein LEA-2 subgroup domain-containing protein n=1 Tax=Clitoria ternatea TaxID=43366 RepID=A0AAN9F9B4_CLITE
MDCKPRCNFCWLCSIFCIFFAIVSIIVLSIIISWLALRPSNVKFYITNATLTQFNLTTNNTLYYNLKLNITVRNPNKHITVHYKGITAIAWYKDNEIARISLTPFDQGHKNTTFLEADFEGQSVVDLKAKQLGEYKQETSVGIYNDLAVDLDLRIKAKFGFMGKSSSFNPPTVQCRRLRVSMISNGISSPPFSVTKCITDSFFSDRDAPVQQNEPPFLPPADKR